MGQCSWNNAREWILFSSLKLGHDEKSWRERKTYILPGRCQIVMPLTLHGEGLARACLSIGKYSTVVPSQNFLDQWSSDNFVNIYLFGICSKNSVKGKVFCQGTLLHHLHLFIGSSRGFNHNRWSSRFLLCANWPEKVTEKRNVKNKCRYTNTQINALTGFGQILGYFGFCLSFLYVLTRSCSEQNPNGSVIN